MILCIPLAHGQTIPFDVYRSISEQTVSFDIMPCCQPGIINSNRNFSIEKLNGEMESKNHSLRMSEHLESEYILTQERDTVHLYDNNFEKAIKYMDENPNVGIISLPWKDYEVTEHIKMQAMVIRKEAVKNFQFRFDERKHICVCMLEDMITLGWGCKYLPSDKKLITERF